MGPNSCNSTLDGCTQAKWMGVLGHPLDILSNIKCRWHHIHWFFRIFLHSQFSGGGFTTLLIYWKFSFFGFTFQWTVQDWKKCGESKNTSIINCLWNCDHIVIYCFWLFDAAKWSDLGERIRRSTKIYWQKLYGVEYSRNFISIWWFLFCRLCSLATVFQTSINWSIDGGTSIDSSITHIVLISLCIRHIDNKLHYR